MQAQIEEEWATSDLGHASRTKRAKAIGGRWAAKPQASFPKMVDSDAELQGLYGFFENDAVDYRELLSAHARASRERVDASESSTILIVHDTTEFSFGGEAIREGLGWITRTTQGFYAHIALALSADGSARPFGVVGLSTIMRERPAAKPKGTKRTHNGRKSARDPERESLRWGALVDETSEFFRGHAVPIHISDREADGYDYFCGRLAKNQRFIVRARELQRSVVSMSGESDGPEKLSVLAQRAVPVIAREAKLHRRPRSAFPSTREKHPPRGQRIAHLEFAAERVRIARPAHLPTELAASIELNVVHVREPEPPADAEAIEWLLLTTEPIDTAEEILRVVDHYRARWTIEELNQAIKTGCAYESRQLETAHGLLLALAICIPVAWQMLALRHVAGVEPNAPASSLITKKRLEVLRDIARKPLPSAPTVLEVLLAIAALGGHIARNGPPGWKTLRLGMNDLLFAEAAFDARDARAKRALPEFDE